MISFDIETSGLDSGKCGIWQIGAVELENPSNYFLEESRIDDDDQVEEGALKVTGMSEEQMRDKTKQSQKELIINFIEWARGCSEKMLLGQSVGFDIMMLQNKSRRYGIEEKFNLIGYRTMDLHTITQLKYLQMTGGYLLKDDGKSNMSLTKVLELCGLSDNRVYVKGEEILKKGSPHNALEDAKLTAECFSRLIYGKNLFPEYSKFKIPEELLK